MLLLPVLLLLLFLSWLLLLVLLLLWSLLLVLLLLWLSLSLLVFGSCMRVRKLGGLTGASQCRPIADNRLDLTSICFLMS